MLMKLETDVGFLRCPELSHLALEEKSLIA
jgi:hypothetical protein